MIKFNIHLCPSSRSIWNESLTPMCISVSVFIWWNQAPTQVLLSSVSVKLCIRLSWSVFILVFQIGLQLSSLVKFKFNIHLCPSSRSIWNESLTPMCISGSVFSWWNQAPTQVLLSFVSDMDNSSISKAHLMLIYCLVKCSFRFDSSQARYTVRVSSVSTGI